MIVLLILICFMLRKRIFRCYLKAGMSDIQCNDSEIRMVRVLEPESVLVLRDPESDPESAVQMKLRSDESDSLNHSESEQINGSCPEDHPVITCLAT
ncbi:hypothetical protein DPX16_0419 [Anabarilius grahami]|uniref:Uncharacterized protein n=1 Tax=Anabarilius grahami TaxID=495550 RepID=A0A3N0YIZ6_ANAGA|nr:hypothetical protein DPX16_0419 [Anabarilius grahami]